MSLKQVKVSQDMRHYSHTPSPRFPTNNLGSQNPYSSPFSCFQPDSIVHSDNTRLPLSCLNNLSVNDKNALDYLIFHRHTNVAPARPMTTKTVFGRPLCAPGDSNMPRVGLLRDGTFETTQPTLQASPPLSLDSGSPLTYCWISEVAASGFFPRIALLRGSRIPFWRQTPANYHTLARGEWRCHPAWYWEIRRS